jgi:uncharacterized repeat protein (TIGR03806 family)
MRSFWLVVLAACQPTVPDPVESDAPDTEVIPDSDSDVQDSDVPIEDVRRPNPTCVAFARPANEARVSLTRAYPQVTNTKITALVPAPGGGWLYGTQPGEIWRVRGTAAPERVLDHTGPVWDGANEAGLLGIAVDPDFSTNGRVVLSYTRRDSAIFSRIVTMTSSDGLRTLDTSSERTVLEVRQPYDNHNGGHVQFDRAGDLLIALGDGGSGGDPLNAGQDTNTLLGKILRIRLDRAPYSVPSDNPFADGGGKPEIYAWGLRNPWKFDVDPATGDVWAGDVGQNAREEVDIIQRGGNYGWRVKEGTRCYASTPCDGPYIDPVVEYEHALGRSITGGVVVRGGQLPGLEGAYLYTDYLSGRLWAAVRDLDDGGYEARLLIDGTGLRVATFARGEDGEILLADHAGGGLYRLQATPADGPKVPPTLSATGCADVADVAEPSTGLFRYELIHPFWSDGAEKTRYLGLPDGTRGTWTSDGDLDLPVGTVLRKDFTREGAPIGVRLFVHHEDGWAGYDYAWRSDMSDADYVSGVNRTVGGGDWHYPSGAACVACHTSAAGRSLGLEARQLARSVRAPDGTDVDQIDRLVRLGFVDPLAERPTPLVDRTDRDVDQAARSWLHVNCAPCHRPGGGAGDMDLRVSTALRDTRACGVVPARGDAGAGPGARLIVPGSADQSVILARVRDTGVWRMPPEGSLRVDVEGADLLERWINALPGCDR